MSRTFMLKREEAMLIESIQSPDCRSIQPSGPLSFDDQVLFKMPRSTVGVKSFKDFRFVTKKCHTVVL